MTSYERHGVSGSRQIKCLFNSFFQQTTKETSKVPIVDLIEGKPPLTDEFSSGQSCGKRFHAITSPWYKSVACMTCIDNSISYNTMGCIYLYMPWIFPLVTQMSYITEASTMILIIKHWWSVDSPHKSPFVRKVFHCNYVIIWWHVWHA